MTQEAALRQVHKLLDEAFWLPTLATNTNYQRTHDDHDGTQEGNIIVTVDKMGDVYLMVDKAMQSLRFRTHGGGGMSLRVRNALLILAEAIRLDNETKPAGPKV
jgi:hypothetical protein